MPISHKSVPVTETPYPLLYLDSYNAGDPGSILGGEDLLETEMAIHSSILAWKTPWTEESGRLQSMGSQSWTKLSDFTFSVIQHQQNPITAKFSYNMLVHAGWVL